MKCKKLIATGLAGVMTLALAAPSFAADTVITGKVEEIEIAVEIPGKTTAVINPYEMPIQALAPQTTGDPKKMGALTTAGKIATQPLIGVSTCEVALDVGATVTGVPQGDLMLSNRDISTLRTKSAVVYLECKQDTTIATADALATAADPISGVAGAKAVAAFNAWPKSSYNFATDDVAAKANADKVLVTEAGSTKLGLCTIAAAKDTLDATGSAGTDGELDPQPGGFFLARLGGDVVQNPTDPWVAADGVIVNVSFTFTPAAPKEGGTISISGAVADSNVKVKAVKPDGTDFTADATYEWTITDPGTTTATSVSTSGALQSAGTLATGTIKIKCTVTDGGVKYIIPETTLTVA